MLIRRTVTTTAATVGALALLSGTALAHDCFVGTPSTKAPKSDNWHSITAEAAATYFAGFVAACDGAVSAGYSAVSAAGLPASIKVFIGGPSNTEHFVLGGGSQTRGDGKGLEVFGTSSVPFDMAATYAAGASAHDCDQA